MKLYLMGDPMLAQEFARFRYSGTWTKGRLCPTCDRSTERVVPPLLIQWEDGSDFLGDLAWAGGSYICIAPQTVRNSLAFLKSDVDWGEVQVLPPVKLRTRRPRVPYPYTGPKLWWMKPKHQVFIHRSFAAKLACPSCGEYFGQFRQSGIILSRGEVRSRKLFRIAENGRSLATFITEDAAERTTALGIRNVIFKEAGVIED